jgi:hypothetical protein
MQAHVVGRQRGGPGLLHDLGDAPQRARGEIVVAVEPAQDVAGGVLQPFVDGAALAAVLLADPPAEPRSVAAKTIHLVVAAAAVHRERYSRLGMTLIFGSMFGSAQAGQDSGPCLQYRI